MHIFASLVWLVYCLQTDSHRVSETGRQRSLISSDVMETFLNVSELQISDSGNWSCAYKPSNDELYRKKVTKFITVHRKCNRPTFWHTYPGFSEGIFEALKTFAKLSRLAYFEWVNLSVLQLLGGKSWGWLGKWVNKPLILWRKCFLNNRLGRVRMETLITLSTCMCTYNLMLANYKQGWLQDEDGWSVELWFPNIYYAVHPWAWF